MQPDINAPVQQAQANEGKLQGIFQGQRNETGDFLNRFSGAVNNQESMSGMAKRIGGELGLPTLQSNANMLRGTLNALPTTYNKATTGYDVNQNQLSRIIGQKSSELAPAVDTAERALGTAQGNLNTQMGYAQADQQKALLPYQSEQSLLSDRMARETTGYTQVMGQELDSIIAKMNAGITLSEGEKNRAQQLAVAEKQFEQAKQLQQMKGPDTQIIDQNGKKILINSQTGQQIASYGTGGASGGGASYFDNNPSPNARPTGTVSTSAASTTSTPTMSAPSWQPSGSMPTSSNSAATGGLSGGLWGWLTGH